MKRAAAWGRICDESKDEITYAFDSAWDPPSGYIKKISRLYPRLHFKLEYFEPNFGYQGVYEVKNGETIKDVDEGFEFGICPFCKKEIGTLPGKHCPVCHKKMDKLIIDDKTGEYIEYGICSACQVYKHVESNGQCRDCNRNKKS